MVTSGLTGVGVPIDASGATLQQTAAQSALMYTRLVAKGVNAVRVYDAVGSGAAVLATANTYGMMGAFCREACSPRGLADSRAIAPLAQC
jgi:hypothetical protein